MILKFTKTMPGAIVPTRANHDDSGLDLYYPKQLNPLMLWYGDKPTLIDIGIAVQLEPGYDSTIMPRSSMNAAGVLCYPGTIDNGYIGALGVILQLSWKMGRSFVIKPGDKIAQLVVRPVLYPALEEVKRLKKTKRGKKGFGSSGK